ncbi:hypothetical protein TNCV_1255131 [Trichonephila clavipes]|nr:hypothetical protein TNCV_1255131 [Trichonephila clavipes]
MAVQEALAMERSLIGGWQSNIHLTVNIRAPLSKSGFGPQAGSYKELKNRNLRAPRSLPPHDMRVDGVNPTANGDEPRIFEPRSSDETKRTTCSKYPFSTSAGGLRALRI